MRFLVIPKNTYPQNFELVIEGKVFEGMYYHGILTIRHQENEIFKARLGGDFDNFISYQDLVMFLYLNKDKLGVERITFWGRIKNTALFIKEILGGVLCQFQKGKKEKQEKNT